MDLIYGIEEPETSQNPINQRMLIEAFLELSEQQGIQVLLTTHTPGIVGLLPAMNLRHIKQTADRDAVVAPGSEAILKTISDELGVTADRRLEVLICVEGPTDIEHLKRYSELLHQEDQTIVDLKNDPKVAMCPLGGSTLRQWVENHYLKALNIREVHIYDRGNDNPRQYQTDCDRVNARVDGSWAVLTSKMEIENYLHPDAINEALGIVAAAGPDDDLVEDVTQKYRATIAGAKPWAELVDEERKEHESKMKKRLVREVLPTMKLARLRAMDTTNEIEGWLRRISAMFR